MMVAIRITLEIEVRPYTADELAGEGCDEEFFDGEDEIDAFQIGECVAALFHEGSDFAQEALAGSNMFVKLGDATLVHATEVPA